MVTFISQCEKNALKKTRRVLDAFADRIGDNAWQTVITEEGLGTVKKMLRQTASKSTAVSCHWLRSRSRSQFLWTVGNRTKFDERGVVPVNFTEQETSQFMDKNHWQTINVILYASAISGLFHDFGKANQLFQDKINPNKQTDSFEPYRHEWISFRLFQGFVVGRSDEQWLEALGDMQANIFPEYFQDTGKNMGDAPRLSELPPLAKLVAWLIMTHHKLPIYPKWKENSPPTLNNADEWLDRNFEAIWNSHNCKDEDQKERIQENWQLPDLPIRSMQWRSKACSLSSEARVKLHSFLKTETDWLHEQLFTTHLSHLSLMLADHFYSSQETITEEWRNPHYKVYANTQWDNGKKQYKQQLDEHLIGVAYHAEKIVKALPRLNASLSALEPNDELTNNVPKECKEEFGWQDKTRKLAEKIGKDTLEHGFFGINMASTGKGKTRANAKIMTALGLQTGRVRFSVALGLRVLTLQTGREYQVELKLSEEDLAIAVGGTAIKQLFENQQTQIRKERNSDEYLSPEGSGSESQEELIPADLYVHYTGAVKTHALSDWTKQEKGLDALLQAPVLVSTIDHLMPATEGTKGGKQIPATLRLLTSDLVLDEPDDFGLEDLPALCRLVNWAGMLGSRVLLSTATIPPALAYALFQAYQAGWSQYAKANIEGWSGEVVCAWFDEWGCNHGQHKEFDNFKKMHEKFVKKRVASLQSLPARRIAEIIKVELQDGKTIAENMADMIQAGAMRLHQAHCLSNEGKTLSIGLVRMANINPLVAVAKALLKIQPEKNTCIHYCIYHSRYPLAVRSSIETKLDRLLYREKKHRKNRPIWQESEIQQGIQNAPNAQHHIFIVLASPVAEVGRDHDYDWAIIEPSSMRAMIQLAGRVLRHRDKAPESPNVLLLHKNYKGLSNKEVCFNRPGFESSRLKLELHDLFEIMDDVQYKQITAIQRIELPQKYKESARKNLVCLEHMALLDKLFTGSDSAKLWWKNHPHWCGEVQRQQRFRDSKKDEAYYLWLDDEYSTPKWQWKNEQVSPPEFGEPSILINKVELEEPATGNGFWFEQNLLNVYQELAHDFSLELKEVSRRFGEVRLVEYGKGNSGEYSYHPYLGIYQDIWSRA